MVQLLSMTVLAGAALAIPAARILRQPTFVDIETTATAPSTSLTNTPVISLLSSWLQAGIISTPEMPKIIAPSSPLPETTKEGGIYTIPDMPKITGPSVPFPENTIEGGIYSVPVLPKITGSSVLFTETTKEGGIYTIQRSPR